MIPTGQKFSSKFQFFFVFVIDKESLKGLYTTSPNMLDMLIWAPLTVCNMCLYLTHRLSDFTMIVMSTDWWSQVGQSGIMLLIIIMHLTYITYGLYFIFSNLCWIIVDSRLFQTRSVVAKIEEKKNYPEILRRLGNRKFLSTEGFSLKLFFPLTFVYLFSLL